MPSFFCYFPMPNLIVRIRSDLRTIPYSTLAYLQAARRCSGFQPLAHHAFWVKKLFIPLHRSALRQIRFQSFFSLTFLLQQHISTDIFQTKHTTFSGSNEAPNNPQRGRNGGFALCSIPFRFDFQGGSRFHKRRKKMGRLGAPFSIGSFQLKIVTDTNRVGSTTTCCIAGGSIADSRGTEVICI